MKFYFIAVALFSFMIGSAQVVDLNTYHGTTGGANFLSEAQIAATKGSPYKTEKFVPANVKNDAVVILDNLNIRYNIYSDDMQNSADNSGKPTGVLLKDPEAMVHIGSETYVYVTPDIVPGIGGYYQVIASDDEGAIYKKWTVEYVPLVKSTTGYDKDKPAKFTTDQTLFLVNNDGVFKELPTSKKKFSEAFGLKAKEIKNFLKKQNIDFSKDADLQKVLSYYHTL